MGADPVFVDIDPRTFNINPNLVEEKIKILRSQNSPIKAIIPVHFAGQSCDMESILSLARKHDLKIIEDAAHALPCTFQKRMIGTSVHFIPLHIQPYWRDRYGFKPEDFPGSLDCYRRAVSLPIYTKMTDEDVNHVIASVRDILTEGIK